MERKGSREGCRFGGAHTRCHPPGVLLPGADSSIGPRSRACQATAIQIGDKETDGEGRPRARAIPARRSPSQPPTLSDTRECRSTRPGRASPASSAVICRRTTGCPPPSIRIPYLGSPATQMGVIAGCHRGGGGRPLPAPPGWRRGGRRRRRGRRRGSPSRPCSSAPGAPG
jgi:hypothetical protein